jgi:hypothetical protein
VPVFPAVAFNKRGFVSHTQLGASAVEMIVPLSVNVFPVETLMTDPPGFCNVTAQFVLSCACSTITVPTGAQSVCINGDPTQLCVNTTNTSANGIRFVFFNTPQTGSAMYTGGTVL